MISVGRDFAWSVAARLIAALLYDQAAEIIDGVFEKREQRRLQSAGPD
jgi:hypothetical protein